MARLDGKVALISGAASGMGEAEAKLFAAEGASVAVCDWKADAARGVAEEISAAGHDARAYDLDVRDEDQWTSVLDAVVADFGGLDILINNAGTGGALEDVSETSLQDWQDVIDVNQTGSFLGIKHSVPHLRRRGGGAIVQVSSTWAFRGVGILAGYAATKAAVAGLARHAAISFAKDNIRVNAICPGLTDTPLIDMNAPGIEHVIEATPMGRPARPEEIAQAVLFLASDEASCVTGAMLFADGGYTAKGQNA